MFSEKFYKKKCELWYWNLGNLRASKIHSLIVNLHKDSMIATRSIKLEQNFHVLNYMDQCNEFFKDFQIGSLMPG